MNMNDEKQDSEARNQESEGAGARRLGSRPRKATTGAEAVKGMLAELAADSGKWRTAAGGTAEALGDLLSGWGAPNYLLAAREEVEALAASNPERVKVLRQLMCDGVVLQRGAYWVNQVKLQQDRLKFDRARHRDKMELMKEQPKVKERMNALRPLTDEERRAIVDTADEIMGLK